MGPILMWAAPLDTGVFAWPTPCLGIYHFFILRIDLPLLLFDWFILVMSCCRQHNIVVSRFSAYRANKQMHCSC